MKPYEELTHRGQVRRLRSLAENALSEYPFTVSEFSLLLHLENTTFRVDMSHGHKYVLRIARPNHRSLDQIRSEVTWLKAIGRDTELVVPNPVSNGHGASVTTAGAGGVPGERYCVLFKWVDGQFYRKRLSPVALERVGRFAGELHRHAMTFDPPQSFTRHNVQWGSEEEPGEMERLMDKGLTEGAAIIAPHDLATFTLARHHLREVMGAVGRGSDRFGLIHADLHHGNCLFYKGEVRAIDFDDCGWGHFLYDLAVTQWYLQARPDFAELQEAHLNGYRQVCGLSPEEEALLPAFIAARTLLMAVYMAGRQDNPKLKDQTPQFVARCAGALRDYLSNQGKEFV